jgi:hypothetical protein
VDVGLGEAGSAGKPSFSGFAVADAASGFLKDSREQTGDGQHYSSVK